MADLAAILTAAARAGKWTERSGSFVYFSAALLGFNDGNNFVGWAAAVLVVWCIFCFVLQWAYFFGTLPLDVYYVHGSLLSNV